MKNLHAEALTQTKMSETMNERELKPFWRWYASSTSGRLEWAIIIWRCRGRRRHNGAFLPLFDWRCLFSWKSYRGWFKTHRKIIPPFYLIFICYICRPSNSHNFTFERYEEFPSRFPNQKFAKFFQLARIFIKLKIQVTFWLRRTKLLCRRLIPEPKGAGR